MSNVNRIYDVIVVGSPDAAIAAARLGARTAIIAIGTHDLAKLTQEGVTIHEILRKNPGNLLPTDIASAAKAFESANVALITLDAPARVVSTAIEMADRCGARVVFDPISALRIPDGSYRHVALVRCCSSRSADIIGMSVYNRTSSQRAARNFLKHGAAAALVKAGDEGSFLVTREHELWVPHIEAKRVDTKGTDDAMIGALCTYFAEGHDLLHAALFASAAAAVAGSREGSTENLPLRDEVMELLNRGSGLPVEDVAA